MDEITIGLQTDTDRINALEKYSWDIRNDGPPSYVYVGPLFIDDKPWGVGETLREAIDDAIKAKEAQSADS